MSRHRGGGDDKIPESPKFKFTVKSSWNEESDSEDETAKKGH